MDVEVQVKKLEQRLRDDICLSSDDGYFDKNINIMGRKVAATSRQASSRNLKVARLLRRLHGLGAGIFVLCSRELSPSALSSIRIDETGYFLRRVGELQIPEAFRTFAEAILEQRKDDVEAGTGWKLPPLQIKE